MQLSQITPQAWVAVGIGVLALITLGATLLSDGVSSYPVPKKREDLTVDLPAAERTVVGKDRVLGPLVENVAGLRTRNPFTLQEEQATVRGTRIPVPPPPTFDLPMPPPLPASAAKAGRGTP